MSHQNKTVTSTSTVDYYINMTTMINNENNNNNIIKKKHLKNVGPIRYCKPPLQCQSPGVASRMPAIAIAQAGVRCPRQQQQQRVTEGTAMAPWNGPNNTHHFHQNSNNTAIYRMHIFKQNYSEA